MAPLTPTSKHAISRLRAYKAPPSSYFALPLSRRACVLVLLYGDRHGELRVVLTVRASDMNSYAGHVAFPGGKANSLEESPFQTARREAYEEIGLPEHDTQLESRFKIEPLCQLPVSLAYTELGVRPCVAFAYPPDDAAADAETSFMPKLNPKEVTAIFTAPFRNFLCSRGPDDVAQGTSHWYKPVVPGAWGDERWPMHQFFVPVERSSRSKTEQKRYRVFGMTARILVDAARVAYGEDPDFTFNERIGEEDVIATLFQSGRMSRPRKPGDAFSLQDMAEAIRPKI